VPIDDTMMNRRTPAACAASANKDPAFAVNPAAGPRSGCEDGRVSRLEVPADVRELRRFQVTNQRFGTRVEKVLALFGLADDSGRFVATSGKQPLQP
jgi:hypothetical protein